MSTLIVVALLLTAGYVIAWVLWPFTACGRCKGTGRRRSPTGKAWGKCRRCDGTGRKVRLGRILYEALGGGDGDRQCAELLARAAAIAAADAGRQWSYGVRPGLGAD